MRSPFKLPQTLQLGTILFALAIGYLPTASRAQENLMPHGDMEVWATPSDEEKNNGANMPDGIPDQSWVVVYPNKTVKGVPEDAEAYSIARDMEVKHGGEASLRIEGTKDTVDFGIHFRPVKIDPSGKYRISMMIKGEGLQPNPKLNGKNVGPFIRWQAGNPKSYWGGDGQISGMATLPDEVKQESFDWTPVVMEVQAADDTEVLGFRVMLQGTAGKLWVDDIKIEPVSN